MAAPHLSPACFFFLLLLLLLALLLPSVHSQQPYINNRQLDCYNTNFNQITHGFRCNGPEPSCPSYVTFRTNPNYNSAASVASLLNSDPSQVRSLNRLSSATAPIPLTNKLLFVPVNCSCSSGTYYQHNTTYKLRTHSETYFTVANNTFQGLSTCQAMMSQNRFGDRNLTRGMNLLVPLRCACPTVNQTDAGFKYLVSYMVTWGDSLSVLAEAFSVNETDLRDANELSSSNLIFPFTTLLVPLRTEPTQIELAVPSPPPPPAQPPSTPAESPGSSSHKRVFVFVGVGIGLALLAAILISLSLFCIRRQKNQRKIPMALTSSETKKIVNSSSTRSALPAQESRSHDLSVRDTIDALKLYKFEALQTATGHFSESNRIKGSAYKGTFGGDNAVVKVMKGDVSAEINLLKMVNHSCIVRLSGFCFHHGNTYLVYECADNGSLSDWFHSEKKMETAYVLNWNQRVQIARDVADALNYIHNYMNPPCIHKNLKSSNVLLDSNLRAKVANFGLARILKGDMEGGDVQLTRHVVGTQGYLAPEYIENGVVTPKLDVFAFGVVMLELLSGKEATKPVNCSGGELLLYESINQVLEGDNVREKLKEFMDPSLRNAYPLELAFSMAQLAKICVARDLSVRPSISQVLATLSMVLSSTLDWDPTDEI